MTRAPLLPEEFSIPPRPAALHNEKRQRPLHYSLYVAALVTLGAALYLFVEGLVLLKESDKQSPWRPGSNLWGYVVQAFGILLLWPGILGVLGCVLKHPVCLGAVRISNCLTHGCGHLFASSWGMYRAHLADIFLAVHSLPAPPSSCCTSRSLRRQSI